MKSPTNNKNWEYMQSELVCIALDGFQSNRFFVESIKLCARCNAYWMSTDTSVQFKIDFPSLTLAIHWRPHCYVRLGFHLIFLIPHGTQCILFIVHISHKPTCTVYNMNICKFGWMHELFQVYCPRFQCILFLALSNNIFSESNIF